jgi:hypothetical protein
MTKRRNKKPPPDIIRRHRAIAETMKKFGGTEMVLGQSDCVNLVRFHLAKMGHRGLPKIPDYSTSAGAKKALKEMGFRNLKGLFDTLLEPIIPAFMLPGDIAVVKAEKGAPAWQVGTVVILIGRKFLGWHPDHPILSIMEPTVEEPFLAAWRA